MQPMVVISYKCDLNWPIYLSYCISDGEELIIPRIRVYSLPRLLLPLLVSKQLSPFRAPPSIVSFNRRFESWHVFSTFFPAFPTFIVSFSCLNCLSFPPFSSSHRPFQTQTSILPISFLYTPPTGMLTFPRGQTFCSFSQSKSVSYTPSPISICYCFCI